MAVSSKTRKALWARSGNRCSICKIELINEKDKNNRTLNLGEECHIISKKNNGPRHIKQDNFDYDSIDNLLLLCCNHHTMIDEQIEKYPVEELRKVKGLHEKWVQTTLENPNQDLVITKKSKPIGIKELLIKEHNDKINLKNCTKKIESEEGIHLAMMEVNLINEIATKFVKDIKQNAPNVPLIIRDNKYKIVDVIYGTNTLLVQYYQKFHNSAYMSNLLFSICSGLFDQNGYSNALYPAKHLEIIRLDLTCDKNGDFGWRNQVGKKELYTSKEITEIWLEKFLNRFFKSENN